MGMSDSAYDAVVAELKSGKAHRGGNDDVGRQWRLATRWALGTLQMVAIRGVRAPGDAYSLAADRAYALEDRVRNLSPSQCSEDMATTAHAIAKGLAGRKTVTEIAELDRALDKCDLLVEMAEARR